MLIHHLGHICIAEAATQHRADAKRRKKFRRDAHDLDLLGRTSFADEFAAFAIDGKAREGGDVAAPLVVIGNRRAVALDSGFRIGVEDCDEPIGFRKGKRTEQNGIDDREDGQVRAEADRDCGERGQREGRSFAKLAKSVAQVVHVLYSLGHHSARSVTMGFTREARRAGIQQAKSAAPARTSVTVP